MLDDIVTGHPADACALMQPDLPLSTATMNKVRAAYPHGLPEHLDYDPRMITPEVGRIFVTWGGEPVLSVNVVERGSDDSRWGVKGVTIPAVP